MLDLGAWPHVPATCSCFVPQGPWLLELQPVDVDVEVDVDVDAEIYASGRRRRRRGECLGYTLAGTGKGTNIKDNIKQ